ncbi:MAG: hypothetical protein WCP21_05260 [Armatimonadota bacterium]
MICGECGKTVPTDADFCPFCATEVKRAARPPVPPPPPPAPTHAAPVGPTTPLPAPPLPAPRPSGPGIVIGAVVAVVVVLMILGGVAAYFVLNRHQPAKTQTGTAATHQPADTTPVAGDGAPGKTPATGTAGGDASDGAARSSTTGAGGLNLDDFVGTWQFVGEPGPWGEGWPFRLRRVGNLITGDVEVPELYDGTSIELKMAAGNGELTGESTEVDNGGAPESHAILMTLSDSNTVMTLKYRGEGGEWFTHVAEKKSGASRGG